MLPKAEAITLDQSSYTMDAYGDINISVSCNNSSNYFVIYNLTTNSLNEVISEYCNVGGPITLAVPANDFSILEVTSSGICENETFYYSECKEQPEFVGEFLFDVNAYTSGGGTPPISAPSVVYNGQSFSPTCGPGAVYFDVSGFLGTTLCGESINFGEANNLSFEIRAIDSSFNYLSPSVYVSAVYNEPVKNRIIQQKPVVSILSPVSNSLFSDSVLIDYKVTDPNNSGDENEIINQGLSDKSVSIYYTDKNFSWTTDSPLLVNPDYKNLIVEGLSAIGQYKWSIKDLIPGNLYRIIVNATDNAGLVGESVSDYFSIDFTAPVFKVKTDPILVKSGDVRISIESSEDLLDFPIVKVTQKGGKTVNIIIEKNENIYEGTYTIQTGYDGTAKIEVQGTDLAGNVGSEITNGGTFSVGVNPPPKPIITPNINKSVVNEEFVSLKGSVREDTQVILSVNGTIISTVKPDSKSNFVFEKIKLEKIKNKGVNYLSVVSRDVFGVLSESLNIEIKYNIGPKISIIKPTNKSMLSGQIDIITKGTDENFDTLLYTYEIISLPDYTSKTLNNNWTTIATEVPGGSFTYDTTDVDDGDYLIRAKVSDGYVVATSTPVSVTIKGSSSYFRFENGTKTVTKESLVTIVGRAIVPSNLSSTISIKAIYYSTDGGIEWEEVKPESTVSTSDQKFSVVFNNLKEGENFIKWRIKDNRDFISGGNHTIVVDKIAPKAPIINNPKNNAIITNDDDENLNKDGIQKSISGKAELDSIVSLIFGDQTLTTKTSVLGEFLFSEIALSKLGKQDIQIFATDKAGNKSASTVLSLVYNNPPIINFINPKPFRGLSGKAILSWNIVDLDGDIIKNVEVSYRNAGEKFKTLISDTIPKGTYVLDTSKLPESGNYELKITATDSITPVSSVASFFIDRTAPVLLSFNIKKEITDKKVNFSGSGTASDGISGIEYVEYSIKPEGDSEKGAWYKGTVVNGYLQKQASFTVKYPNDLPDNSYTIYARAVDAAGNISNELTKNIYVDKTAPRIGSFFISKNNLNLTPDQYGNVSFYKNSTFTFMVSAEQDTKNADLVIGNKNIKLRKNISSGLWEAVTTIDTDLVQNIFVTAIDSSGNITKNKKVGTIIGINKGRVFIDNEDIDEFISKVSIYIYKFDDATGQYNKFAPSIDGIPVDIETDTNGQYELVLPAGDYTISAVKSGFKVIKKEFSVPTAQIISDPFITKKIRGAEKIIADILNRWSY